MLDEVKDIPNILIHVEIGNADKWTGVQYTYVDARMCSYREIAIDNVNLKTNRCSMFYLDLIDDFKSV